MNNQFALYIPVVLVLVCVILIFAFSFKKPEQPPFDKLTSTADDRKLSSKKRKTKDKVIPQLVRFNFHRIRGVKTRYLLLENWAIGSVSRDPPYVLPLYSLNNSILQLFL